MTARLCNAKFKVMLRAWKWYRPYCYLVELHVENRATPSIICPSYGHHAEVATLYRPFPSPALNRLLGSLTGWPGYYTCCFHWIELPAAWVAVVVPFQVCVSRIWLHLLVFDKTGAVSIASVTFFRASAFAAYPSFKFSRRSEVLFVLTYCLELV